MVKIDKENLQILKELSQNNDRDWFNENKIRFKMHERKIKSFFEGIYTGLSHFDKVDRLKVFRIYRDVRFSKNKLPYKTHFAASFHRIKPALRGGYYVHIQPNDKSFIATGFWNPEKDDLWRIRKELEMDADGFRDTIQSKQLKEIWGKLEGDQVKTVPRDFGKDHKDIDLIKKKQYIFSKNFTDIAVTSDNFILEIENAFKAIRPFFDYMSEVLTTDLNGESLIK